MESNRTTSSILLPTLVVGLGALIVFTSTLSFFPFPGESAAMLVRYGGIDPLPTAYHPLYALVTQCFTALPMGTLAFRIGLVSTLCGAACVAILFGMVANLRYWQVHDDEAPYLPLLAGLPAAAYLLVAPPFWASANRAHPILFHLSLLLFALALLQRYGQDADRRSLAGAAFLFGLLLLEWAGALLIFPFVIAATVLYLHGNSQLQKERLLLPILAFTVGVVTFIALFYVRLDWATANLVNPPALHLGPALVTLIGEHLFLLKREFHGVDGVLIAIGSIVPWLVAMVCARHEGESEAFSGSLMLHIVLTLLCLILLFLGTVSPGMLNDLHSLAAVPPIVAIAAVFGYVVGYWYILVDRTWAERPAVVTKFLAVIGVAVCAVMFVSAKVNTARTSTGIAEATHQWASALLLSLPTNSVVIASSNEQNILVVTAREQARPITPIDLTRAADPEYRAFIAKTLAPAALRDLAEQNLPRFLEAWTWQPAYPAGRVLTTGDPTPFERAGRGFRPAATDYRNEKNALSPYPLRSPEDKLVPTLLPNRSAPDFLDASPWQDHPSTHHAEATGEPAPFERAGRTYQPALTGYRDVSDPENVWHHGLLQQHQAFWDQVVPALRRHRATPGFPGSFCRGLVRKASRTANDLALLAWEHGDYRDAHIALKAARAMEFNNRHAAANQFLLLSQTGQSEEAASTWTAVDALINADRLPTKRTADGELLGAHRLRTFAQVRGASQERLPDSNAFREAFAVYVINDGSAPESIDLSLTQWHATDADGWLLAGLMAADRGDSNRFAECTTRLTELRTDYTPLHIAAARQRISRNDIEGARQLMQDAVTRQPADIDVLETIATIELMATTPASQPVYLHRLLSLDPDNAMGHLALGARLLTEGNRGRARQELVSAAARGEDPRAILLAALLTDTTGGPVPDQTADLALRGIDAELDDPNYWTALEGLLGRMERPGVAAYAAGQAKRFSADTPQCVAFARLIEAAQPAETIEVAATVTDPDPTQSTPQAQTDDEDLRTLLSRVVNSQSSEPPAQSAALPAPPAPVFGEADLDDEKAPVPLVW